VTLQAADKCDIATMDETLIEAGMAVAELAVREAESCMHDTKVNLHGIEELHDGPREHAGQQTLSASYRLFPRASLLCVSPLRSGTGQPSLGNSNEVG